MSKENLKELAKEAHNKKRKKRSYELDIDRNKKFWDSEPDSKLKKEMLGHIADLKKDRERKKISKQQQRYDKDSAIYKTLERIKQETK